MESTETTHDFIRSSLQLLVVQPRLGFMLNQLSPTPTKNERRRFRCSNYRYDQFMKKVISSGITLLLGLFLILVLLAVAVGIFVGISIPIALIVPPFIWPTIIEDHANFSPTECRVDKIWNRDTALQCSKCRLGKIDCQISTMPCLVVTANYTPVGNHVLKTVMLFYQPNEREYLKVTALDKKTELNVSFNFIF